MADAFVAFLYGGMFTILGVACLLHTTQLKPAVDSMLKDPVVVGIAMFLMLPLGLAGVWFHNYWSLGPGLAITIFAWMLCIDAVLFALFPGVAQQIMKWWTQRIDLTWSLRLDGGLSLLCGLLSFWQAYLLTRDMTAPL